MSTRTRTWMWKSFSIRAGGGVRGKGDGIVRGTIVQVGATIRKFHLFTGRYHRTGGIPTETVAGKRTNGTDNEYHTRKFRKTGRPGKTENIGRGIITGVSKDLNPEMTPGNKNRK